MGTGIHGEPVSFTARGWPARIRSTRSITRRTLYVDRMLTRSFATVSRRGSLLGRSIADVRRMLGAYEDR